MTVPVISEAKKKISESAQELFIRYGIRSVSMDDVAREASMSKKTLYQYFENKEELVFEVVVDHFEKEKEEFDEIADLAENAVHEVILVSQCMRRHVFRMNPSLLYDMQKFHGKAWNEYLRFKHEIIRKRLEKNLGQGMQEGFFRKDLDPEILSVFRVEQVQMVFDPKVFPPDRFDFREVQIQILDHFIHGLLTKEGRKKYKEYAF